MPSKPKKDESFKEYMGHCIPKLVDEGKNQEKAKEQCAAVYNKHKKSEMVREKAK